MEDGTVMTGEDLVARDRARKKLTQEQVEQILLHSDNPKIWRPL